jgi:hypothetical protein
VLTINGPHRRRRRERFDANFRSLKIEFGGCSSNSVLELDPPIRREMQTHGKDLFMTLNRLVQVSFFLESKEAVQVVD